MLPDIRAVFGTIVAAIGLLMIAFGVVATYRVSRENQTGPLQADLRRSRDVQLASATQRPVLIVQTPGPHLAPRATPLAANPVPFVEVAAALAPPLLTPPPPAAPPPVALTPEPPIGGPLAPIPAGTPVAALPDTSRNAAAENPAHADTRALERAAAAAKAKARAARVARERRAAARRAAARRIAQEKAARSAAPFGTAPFGATTPFGGSTQFGGTFGGTFTTPRE
jgi:type IV secretory pathway VirB10-like protein